MEVLTMLPARGELGDHIGWAQREEDFAICLVRAGSMDMVEAITK